jgi:hypothetical protein
MFKNRFGFGEIWGNVFVFANNGNVMCKLKYGSKRVKKSTDRNTTFGGLFGSRNTVEY